MDYVRRCLGLAAEIGAPLVQMLASGEPRLAPIATRDAEWAWSVAGMQAAARDAERIDVRIAVEPLNRYEAYLVTSAREALAYLDAVGSPCGRHDARPLPRQHRGARHRRVDSPGRAAALARAGRRHARDAAWVTDTSTSPAVTVALAEIDYGGAVVVEIMAPGPDPFQAIKDEHSAAILDKDLRESLTQLRAHWPRRAGADRSAR